jgi:hypothetical protein
MSGWVSGSQLDGAPGVPVGGGSRARWAERQSVERRKRQAGKGWEYRRDTLPVATQAYLAAIDGDAEDTRLTRADAATTVVRGPWRSAQAEDQTSSDAYLLDIAPLAAHDADTLRAWSQDRALRLSLADLQDAGVQKRLRCARDLERCARGEKMRCVAALAAEYGVSEPTIRRWADEVEGWRVQGRHTTVTLTDTRVTVPTSRSFEPAAAKRGVAIYANALRAGKKAAYEALLAEAEEYGWRVGDYTSFTRLIGKISPRVWEGIRKGRTGFELAVAPKITRAWLETPVYTVLCGDQNIPDYQAEDALGCQVFEESTGEIFTPELYLWMDCTSRAWTGLWPAWGHYDKYTVGYSLREACRIATPDEIFTDWGKPELSRYMGQLVSGLNGQVAVGDWDDYAARYAGIGADPDDRVTHRKTTRVGIPWQKPIENQMNVLKRGLLNRFTPGFRQRLPGEWENEARQKELKRAREQGKLLTTEEFLGLVRDIAADHNREACKVRETTTPIVPAEVLARGLREHPRTVYDDRTLDLLFLPRFTRTPNQSTVRVQIAPGDLRHYYAPELSTVLRGQRVQVSVDPFDRERGAVISTLGGEFVALAEPWHVQSPTDRAGLSQKISRQMELMRWWREQIKQLRGDTRATPRIAAATKTARAAARAEQARPGANKGASKRADDKLIELYGGAG